MNEALFQREELGGMNLCENPLTEVEIQLTGQNGNVYNLVATAYNTLKCCGYDKYAEAIKNNYAAQGSYQGVIEYLSTFARLL